MAFDFDTVIDRHGTNSIKYDFAQRFGQRGDALPLWVADMDFPTAPAILERLEQQVRHGIFGYSEAQEDYFYAVASWYRRRFGWDVQRRWLVKTPGVVFAIAAAIRALTKEGDAVLIQQPVYYPFANMIAENGRRLVNSPLVLKDGVYRMDLADMRRKIEENDVKLFLLCSPHNPVGRVWTEQELRDVGALCQEYGVLVVSDEIHSDFVFAGHTHHVFAALSPAFADFTVTCTAPSKTFNLAGLQASNIFISNPELRHKFKGAVSATGLGELNIMGLVACQAAYERGEDWLEELKEYLTGNLNYVREFLHTQLPEIQLIEPEGTYLLWLDFRALGLTREQQRALVAQKARLWLDSGTMFGDSGVGFERINIACPRSTLREAMERLEQAVHDK